MNRFLLLTYSLLILGYCYAQNPAIRLHLNRGSWLGHVKFPDPYSHVSQKFLPQIGAGMGLDWRLADGVSLSPELSLEYYGLKQDYGSAKSLRDVEANLSVFYGRISPGIAFTPLKWLSIRAGFNIMFSALTRGEYLIRSYKPSTSQTLTILYEDDFSRIRNPLSIVPELGFGFNFPLESGGLFSLRLNGFVGSRSMFVSSLWTPFNPRIAQLSLGLAYTFGKRS
ncbi:MAG: hypothetical protein U0176_16100 [Bacteroidia bacterium]